MKKVVLLIVVCFSIQTLIAQKNIAIYWDASYSMKDRKIDRELKFLDNYFKKNTEVNVILNMFSNDILLKENYKVEGGDWVILMQELKKTIYDGGTSYNTLFKDKVDEYLLFTDGIENMNKLDPPIDKPLYIISSLEETNTTNLKLISDLSSGRFVYLNTEFTTQSVEKKEELISDVNDGFISGNVSGLEGNLPNVSIVNQSSNNGIASASNGNYRLKADEGDIIIFSYLGKKTVSIRVSKSNIINITMADINQGLEEVILTAETEKEEVVNTGNQVVDKKRLGYDVESIGSDDISDLDTDLIGAVQGQFTNFTIQNDVYDKTDISKFLGRGRNMTILLNQYGLVVVDGVPLGQTQSNFGGLQFNQDNIINPELIESITYLKGLAATNKYGSAGRNGVLLIATKNLAGLKATKNIEKKALGTTATYTGSAEDIGELADVPYIKVLEGSKTIDEAFYNYLIQREEYGDLPSFYLDAYDYFKGWNNALLSDRILSNIFEIAYTNATMLKAVAYKQQASGNYEDAILTHQHLLKLESGKSQTYRDLALIYNYAGHYQEAIDLYKRMDNQLNVGNADFSGILKTINNEKRNLIAQQKGKLDVTGVHPRFLKAIKNKARIVFEWNDLDAEFDLNIINPQKRFYTWSHTQAENSQRILQQHQQGYGLEEFYLTSDDIGEWKFNMTYYGKTSNDKAPTFVKITIYNNYGSPNQSKKINVVRLDQENIEQTVVKLNVN